MEVGTRSGGGDHLCKKKPGSAAPILHREKRKENEAVVRWNRNTRPMGGDGKAKTKPRNENRYPLVKKELVKGENGGQCRTKSWPLGK